nr:hypothetical protein [Tanacetum cinerariifolium]
FKTYDEYKDAWIYEWNKGIPWGELKDKALTSKAILKESINVNEESSDDARPRKYSELTPAEAIQAVCDVKETNIILQVNLQPQQAEFTQLDSSLTVPVFKQGDDPIDAINHMMSFLSVVVTSRYPTTNNQLRNSSNPRQQATINDGRATLQPIHRRQISFANGITRTYTPGASGSNSRKQRTVICYNDKGNGHMSKQCTKPKSKRGDSSFKDKVENSDNTDNSMKNPGVQAAVQNSNSSAQQDPLILYVIDHLKTQVIDCIKINLENENVNDTLTAELERYKEQVKVLKEGQNVDLKSQDNVSDSCEQSVDIDHLKQTLSK